MHEKIGANGAERKFSSKRNTIVKKTFHYANYDNNAIQVHNPELASLIEL
jgi:hypothetical protein